MVGPRRSAATQADTRRSVEDASPQRQNGDAAEPSQVEQRNTAPATEPGTDRPRTTGGAGAATSRIRSFGCEISDPQLMSAGEIARFLVVYLFVRLPAALLSVVMYPHILKAIPADTRNLQLEPGELITVAVCVALFIVLASISRIPRRQPRNGQPPDRT